jgi:hypothetical protein
MRVIGVTNTLAQDKMQAEGPDAIRSGIGKITVKDLMGLKRVHAGAVQSADSVQQDRIGSNGQAGTSQKVSE